MARYSTGMTTAGAGTAVRPVFGLLSTATVTALWRELQVWNTTQTACAFRIVHFTGGTAGADQTESRHRANAPAATCIAKGLWTADATVVEDTGYHLELGDAYGAAAVVYFGDTGLESRLGATAGIGLIPIGSGQVVELTLVFDE